MKTIKNDNKQRMFQAYGAAERNSLTGWYLDEVIDFGFWHNAYIKGRMSLQDIIPELMKKCSMSLDDLNSCVQKWHGWAEDVAQVLEYCIVHFVELVDEYEGGPDECSLEVSAQIVSDSLLNRNDAYYYAEKLKPHSEAQRVNYDLDSEALEGCAYIEVVA